MSDETASDKQWIVTLALSNDADDAIGQTVLTAIMSRESTMIRSEAAATCAALPIHAVLSALMAQILIGTERGTMTMLAMQLLGQALEIEDDNYHDAMHAQEN